MEDSACRGRKWRFAAVNAGGGSVATPGRRAGVASGRCGTFRTSRMHSLIGAKSAATSVHARVPFRIGVVQSRMRARCGGLAQAAAP